MTAGYIVIIISTCTCTRVKSHAPAVLYNIIHPYGIRHKAQIPGPWRFGSAFNKAPYDIIGARAYGELAPPIGAAPPYMIRAYGWHAPIGAAQQPLFTVRRQPTVLETAQF
jgi:hypothetical protein